MRPVTRGPTGLPTEDKLVAHNALAAAEIACGRSYATIRDGAALIRWSIRRGMIHTDRTIKYLYDTALAGQEIA